MRIQHNIMAMNAYRNYANSTSALSKNLKKLSSSYKINRAGNDAAGLTISEKIRAQIIGLDRAQDNAKGGISLVQTAEGVLTEVHDMLNRMYELAEQSASGTFEDGTDRKQFQKEVNQLKNEINRIAGSANFNGIKLLGGSMSANATTRLTSVATSSKADVDLNIVADSVYDATGKQTELDLGLSAITKASSVGVSVPEDDTVLVTVQGKDTDGITAEEIQAMLADAKATSTSVSEDMMDAVRNATITDTGISALTNIAQGNQWTCVNTVKSTVTANKGESLVLQIDGTSDSFNQLWVGIKNCHVDTLGLTNMKIGDQDGAVDALDMVKSAINCVSDVRGTLGATQNRLDRTINNLPVMRENIQGAESTIRDTDVADEMMAYTKNNILIQSAQTMLAQANQVPQGVLQLLQ